MNLPGISHLKLLPRKKQIQTYFYAKAVSLRGVISNCTLSIYRQHLADFV